MLNDLTRNYTTLVKPTTHLRKQQIREHELASILRVWSIHLGAGRKEWVTLDLLHVALFNPHCCCKWKEFPGSFQEEETKYQKAVPLLLVIRWGFKYVMVRFQALCLLLVSWMSPATNFPAFLFRAHLSCCLRTVTRNKSEVWKFVFAPPPLTHPHPISHNPHSPPLLVSIYSLRSFILLRPNGLIAAAKPSLLRADLFDILQNLR